MNRIATAASCAIALCLACDSGTSATTQGPPAATSAPGAKSEVKPGVEPDAKPDAKPAAKPAAPTGPVASGSFRLPSDPGYDCGKLLTRSQLNEVCSVELQQVIIDGNEGSRDQTRCSRRWRSQDKKRTVSMTVGKYAKPLTKPANATDVAGAGDLGYTWTDEKTPEIVWHTGRVRQGEWVIDIRSIVTDGGEPLCSLEQLGKLGGDAITRIQQAG